MTAATSQHHQQHDSNSKEHRVTVMVILVCVLFIILTPPLSVYYLLVFNSGQLVYRGSEMVLVEYVILILALSNHATNFLWYAIASTNSRRELKALCVPRRGCCCCCDKKNGGGSGGGVLGQTRGDFGRDSGEGSVVERSSVTTVSSAATDAQIDQNNRV